MFDLDFIKELEVSILKLIGSITIIAGALGSLIHKVSNLIIIRKQKKNGGTIYDMIKDIQGRLTKIEKWQEQHKLHTPRRRSNGKR